MYITYVGDFLYFQISYIVELIFILKHTMYRTVNTFIDL